MDLNLWIGLPARRTVGLGRAAVSSQICPTNAYSLPPSFLHRQRSWRSWL